ncbi:MAG: DNA-processing protein DprA [Burkholderiales bacterium]|nr:DNA-processing protein DprA [Burkholderiales bacterium]
MEREELRAWLRLQLTPGVGDSGARRLLAQFGLPQQIFQQSAASLEAVVSATQAAALLREPAELSSLLESTWQWLQTEADARRVLPLGDPDYPQSLLNIEDPPLLLYAMGPAELWRAGGLNRVADRCLAVVGSRNPTPQGAANARQFSVALAQAGLTIVSGMALGIDGAAHEGALEGADADSLATIAVVGTGLDRVYPKQHRVLAHRIAQRGMLLSEYALGTPPLAANFPRRNRIISGLSQGTLVVEAALQSGSLITARLATEQGKDVFAIPGSIHSTQARGCHALIKQGAKLVESAQDILEELQLDNRPYTAPDLIATHAIAAEAEGQLQPESVLLQALGYDATSLDTLQARTGLDTAALQAQLMTLELQGEVTRLPGGLFQRLVQA